MTMTGKSLEFLRLTEADEQPENQADLELKNPTDDNAANEYQVLEQGGIPQDTKGVESDEQLNLEAINVAFESGNFQSLSEMPMMIQSKTDFITRTLEPLIEKALIELLGASTMYKRVSSNNQMSPGENGAITIVGTFVFKTQFWIGMDIEKADVDHDAQYVMKTLQPVSQIVRITQCAIDTGQGTLTVSYSY